MRPGHPERGGKTDEAPTCCRCGDAITFTEDAHQTLAHTVTQGVGEFELSEHLRRNGVDQRSEIAVDEGRAVRVTVVGEQSLEDTRGWRECVPAAR